MKKFFSSGFVFGLSFSALSSVTQAQYYGNPVPQGLAPSGYAPGPQTSPYRVESSPLRVGVGYPHLAQQQFQPVHQHVGGSPIQAYPNQSGLPVPAQQVPGNVIQAQAAPFQAGPMTVSPAQVAPLPPVNAGNPYSNMTAGGEYIAPLQPIPMNSTYQNGSTEHYPQPQQNFDHYPSTHASTYGNYGSVPSAESINRHYLTDVLPVQHLPMFSLTLQVPISLGRFLSILGSLGQAG